MDPRTTDYVLENLRRDGMVPQFHFFHIQVLFTANIYNMYQDFINSSKYQRHFYHYIKKYNVE